MMGRVLHNIHGPREAASFFAAIDAAVKILGAKPAPKRWWQTPDLQMVVVDGYMFWVWYDDRNEQWHAEKKVT